MGGPQQRTGLAGKQKGCGSLVFEESEVDMSRLFSQMPLLRRDRATKSRCFLLPSRIASDGDAEGCPVAEAQLSGLPVVTTRHTGIP
jgi:hypothetical protein